MNNPNNDADEDAARRLQEQLWAGNDDVDVDGNGDNNNAGAVQDFVRQLLDRDNNDNNNDNNNGGGGDGDDAGDNNDNENDDEASEASDDDVDAAERQRDAIDGGIAGEVRDEQQIKITRSLKCPLVLYFECHDDLDELLCPGNPILKRGTTVFIGLDKNTKLSLVFHQFCKFVNSKIPKKKKGAATVNVDAVKLSDFEFLHCTLLDASHTVEASAMMKNDRIKVCRERSKERSAKAEVLRAQRESDRKYFKDLRQLLPDPSPGGMGCDVVLDCRGKVVDERGFSQNVLATTVRANSVLISQRCKWLGQKISAAREDIRRRAEMTVPSDEEKSDLNNEGREEEEEEDVVGDGHKSMQSEDEDDIIMAEPVAGDNNLARGDLGSAAKVEDDEDEDPRAKVKAGKAGRSRSPARKPDAHHSSSSASPNSVWITLDHSPEAVKLLLEYCYTNRATTLGLEAFNRASKFPNPKDVGTLTAKQSGPVAPFRKHEWPQGGMPTVNLHLALAGIALAEEAHMPRLSLMCEIAASQLVDSKNVIDVLGACQVQQAKTGNRLPILRKAAMLDCIMANGSEGIDQLYNNANFKSNLDERKGLVIPSLLDGTVEVMPSNMNTKDIRKKKDRMANERKDMFERNDSYDKHERMKEREKWRDQEVVTRRMEVAGLDERTYKAPSAADSKNIWRDSYRRDPPPHHHNQNNRGTKRKAFTKPTVDGSSGGATTMRNVRRRQSRKKNSLA